jgi:hypothetical protein
MTDSQEMFVFFFVFVFVILFNRLSTPKSNIQSLAFDTPKIIREMSTFANQPIYGQGLGKDPMFFEQVYDVDEGSSLFILIY